MRDLAELNINDGGGNPVATPPPTAEQLAYVESLAGAKLPPAYVQLLLFANGGCPELDTFYVNVDGDQEEWSVNCFFDISDDHDSTENIAWNYLTPWGSPTPPPRHMLPIADNGLGDLICLDLSQEGYGRVVIWIHDEPGLPLIPVAESFEQFIDMLTMYPDDI